MRRATMAILVGVLFSVAATGTASAAPAGGTDAPPKGAGSLTVKKLDSGAYGKLHRRQVVVATSAKALSEAIGQKVPASGEGTYLAACWGGKPTGGYAIKVASASKTGGKVSVGMRLLQPAPGSATTQAFTYPYTVVVVKDLNPRGKPFSFFAQNGKRLDWPLRRV